MRRFLDNLLLLFVLGVAIFAVFYLVWGMMEINRVPPLPQAVKERILTQQVK